MSRRARAAGFAAAAAICAALAAAATGGAPAGGAEPYGALTEVMVAVEPLPAGRPLGRRTLEDAVEIRRVPDSFVAPDALASPAQALGRKPAATIPEGGYLLASQFAAPAPSDRRGGDGVGRLAGDRRPVEISVEGAAALSGDGAFGRVDVVVTSEATAGGGAGRTFVAAEDVRLLELRPAGETADGEVLPSAGGETWLAMLALTRGQALELIHAESFAREVRLIGA